MAKRKNGLSELSQVEHASPDDIDVMQQGYTNIISTLDLSPRLEELTAEEALEIAADIQFVYDMGKAEAIRLNTEPPTEEELKSDTALNQMRSFEDELLRQVAYAADFENATGIGVEIPKEILETISGIQQIRAFEGTSLSKIPETKTPQEELNPDFQPPSPNIPGLGS